jgi:hypothetical protein
MSNSAKCPRGAWRGATRAPGYPRAPRGPLRAGGGEEHVGVAAFLVRTAADLAQAEHLEEGDRVLQRTYADHGAQIFSRGVSSGQRVRGGAEKGRGEVRMIRWPPDPLMGSAPRLTSTAHVRGPRARSSRQDTCSHRSLAGSAPCTRAANIPRSAPRSPPIPERACRVHCMPPQSDAPPL